MRLSTFPWWVTLPGSGGIAAMSTFLPDLEPWQRGVGFAVGAALFSWGVIGALWHFYRSGRGPKQVRFTLNDVARRVAYESEWGVNFELGSYDYVARYIGDPWRLLMLEICRPLTLGDIKAWGVKNVNNKTAENGPTEIPKEYWTRAEFHPELMLTEPSISNAGGGDGAPIYTAIELDRAGVDDAWPRVHWWQRRRSRFRSLYPEWRAKWDAEHEQHAQWINRTAASEPADGKGLI